MHLFQKRILYPIGDKFTPNLEPQLKIEETMDFSSQNKFFNELDEHSLIFSGKVPHLLVQDVKIKGLKSGIDYFLQVEGNRFIFQTELSSTGTWKEDFSL